MAEIKAADVAKLRQMTGAGMMDCKVALSEANGDFDVAIDVLRKKGQKVAGKRADREATEGAVIGKVSADAKMAAVVVLSCETDFVAKNADFVKFAEEIADLAVAHKVTSSDELKALKYKDTTIGEEVINKNGVIGEKIELSYYEYVTGDFAVAYIHPGNRLSSIAAFNKSVDANVAKDVVMQIAAMKPLSIDQNDMPQNIIDKEIEIGKELAIQEGKPVDMAEKIALGRLSKFYKESTLMNQQFIKDSKISVAEYLKTIDKDLKALAFKRYGLGE